MQKALTIAAIASLSLASEAMEDNQLNIFKTLGNDIKKAGQFVVSHPQIITTAVKILAKDDEMTENELNFWGTIATDAKKAGNFVVQHPELINTAVKILHRDDEVNDDELNFFKSLGNGIKKAANFVIEHPQVISTASKILARDDEIGDDELNFWGSLKTDVKKAGEFVVQHPQIVTTAVKILAKDDEIENELNIFKSIGNGVKKAGQFVVSHPQIITTAAKFLDDEEMAIYDPTVYDPIFGSTKPRFPIRPTPTFPERPIYMAFSDEELNILSTIKKDAKKAAEYAVSHPELVVKAVDLVKSISHHDDDELNIFKSIGNGLKKAGQFVVSHPQIITTAAKFLDDEEADQELFNLGKTISKVGHVAKDGLNVYKNVQSGNYVGAIKSGVQTVKDIKHHDDEELFNLGKTISKVGHVAKDGLNVYKNVQSGNYVGAIKSGVQTVKDIKHHDDEELFNIHNAIHHAEEGVRKAGEYVAKHPETVKKAQQTVDEIIHAAGHKDVRRQAAKQALKYVAQHPEVIKKAVEKVEKLVRHHKTKKTEQVADEALFNLGGLIKDGLNIYGDIKNKNYGGLVNDGIQTFKDIKQKKHDDEELFNIHNAIHKVEGDIKNAAHRAEQGVKVAEHYVYDHRQQIANGAKKAVNYVAEHPEVVKQAIEIIKNLKHQDDDEELFNLGGLIKDGLNIAKDVKSHNYGDLVNHGIQTVKDVKETVKDVKHKRFLGH